MSGAASLRRAGLADRRRGGRQLHLDRPRHRPPRRLHPLARRDRHAHHGRADGHPRHAARHRAGVAVRREPVTVIVAITVPEVPRVVRLVRSVVLSVREEPYVEAAISVGTRLPLILLRHVLPNACPR